MASWAGVAVGEPHHSEDGMLSPWACRLFYKCATKSLVCRLWITVGRRA